MLFWLVDLLKEIAAKTWPSLLSEYWKVRFTAAASLAKYWSLSRQFPPILSDEQRQTLHDLLIIDDTAGDKFQEIVIPPRDQMAFDAIVDFLERGLGFGEVNLSVILEGDFGKHDQRFAQALQINLCRIASYISCVLQFFDPHQAGTGA